MKHYFPGAKDIGNRTKGREEKKALEEDFAGGAARFAFPDVTQQDLRLLAEGKKRRAKRPERHDPSVRRRPSAGIYIIPTLWRSMTPQPERREKDGGQPAFLDCILPSRAIARSSLRRKKGGKGRQGLRPECVRHVARKRSTSTPENAVSILKGKKKRRREGPIASSRAL